MELKIHHVMMQTNDLARGYQELTRKMESNESFHKQHQERMEKIRSDILSTKENLQKHLQSTAGDGLDLREYQKEVVAVKTSMSDVRTLVDELVDKVDQLPTLAEAKAVLAGVTAQREACEAAAAVCEDHTALRTGQFTFDFYDVVLTSLEFCHKPIQTRIQETIKSTRRWHHDHKSTTLDDGKFTANYLKKQSKRDPRMAVYIQKALHRRIRRRGRGSTPEPRSLEEFCRDVSWEDVTRTVEDVLVRRVEATVRSLSQSSRELL